MTCYYQTQPSVRGYRRRLHAFWNEKDLFQLGEQRVCDQGRIIQKKDWLPQLQFEGIRKLVESGENNVKVQQEEQTRTGTESVKQVTEQHIAQNEEYQRRGEEHAEVLIYYDNIDTVEK